MLLAVWRGLHNVHFYFAFGLFATIGALIVFVSRAPVSDKYWEALTAIATSASVIVLLVAAWVAVSQLTQLRATYQVDAFIKAAESVDSQEYEKALTWLRALEPVLDEPDTALNFFRCADDATIAHFKESALIVGNALERIGAMIAYGALDRDLIMDYMALTITKSYGALEYARRNTLPGEGWTFIDGLAKEAQLFLDAVVQKQPQPCFVDGTPSTGAASGGLIVSLKVDCRSRLVPSYAGDGAKPYYELAIYVKNDTSRRVRSSAVVSLNAEPQTQLSLIRSSRPVPSYLDSLPAAHPTASGDEHATTLLIEPGKYQSVISMIASGPDDKPAQCTWTITTTMPRATSYEGTLEIPLARHT
jgi:hypothetical protein